MLQQFLVNHNLLSKSEVLNIALNHVFLIFITCIIQGICHVYYDVFYKGRKVSRSYLNLYTLKFIDSDERKLCKIVRFRAADFELEISLLVFEQSRVKWRNVFALAKLINKLSVLACHISRVVASLTILISEANPSKWIFFLVNFNFDQVPQFNQVNIGLSMTFSDDVSDNCRWDLWYKLCITKRLKVTTVLEHSR